MSASDEVDNATGEAPAKVDVVQLLAEKRAALNAAQERYKIAKSARDEQAMSDESRLLDALRELIPILETDAAVVLETSGRKVATDRLKGIKRAAGSLREELNEDDAKVRDAENELAKANAARTAHARQYESYQAEVAALVDRFDLPALKLEILTEPPRIEAPRPWQYNITRPSFEQCEHNLRTRRDYAEIAGPHSRIGYSIIMTAGLKPFRPLTEQERGVLDDREDERKPDPFLQAAVVEAQALGQLGVPGGHITRG